MSYQWLYGEVDEILVIQEESQGEGQLEGWYVRCQGLKVAEVEEGLMQEWKWK